jgi:hypothetical protein
MAGKGKPGPNKSAAKMTMVGVYFPPDEREKIKSIADKEARSESNTVLVLTREALAARDGTR